MNKIRERLSRDNLIKFSVVSIFIIFILISVIFCLITIQPKDAKAETIEELKSQVAQAEQLYDKALADKYAAEARYNECQETIEYASWKIPELQNQIGIRAKEMYMNGRSGSLINLFLGSGTLNDLIVNIDYMNKVNEQDANLVKNTKELREEAKAAQADIWPSYQAAKESESTAASVFFGILDTIEALEAQNVPVMPPGGGGEVDPGGGGGGDIPVPGPTPGPLPDPVPGDVVSRALGCLGCPYGWGCAGPDCYDCSGLVSFAYTGQYVHYWSTYSIRTEGGEGIGGWWRTDSPTNGTVCCSMEHCGIYYNGMMIHAPEPGDVVKIGPIQGDMLFYNR